MFRKIIKLLKSLIRYITYTCRCFSLYKVRLVVILRYSARLSTSKSILNPLKPTGYVMHQQFNILKPTGYLMHQQFNLLKPTGHVMHQQFNLLKPTGYVMHQQFTIQQLYVLPTLCLCVLYLSENKQRLVPLTSINWLVFITEMKSVYCAVRTGSLNKAVCTSYSRADNHIPYSSNGMTWDFGSGDTGKRWMRRGRKVG